MLTIFWLRMDMAIMSVIPFRSRIERAQTVIANAEICSWLQKKRGQSFTGSILAAGFKPSFWLSQADDGAARFAAARRQ